MKVFFYITFISFFCVSSYAEDMQGKCYEKASEPEVFKLLETVKNDILGTVPRFCRAGEYEQLSEQVDPGEKSLSHFVEQLRDLKIKEKDAFKVEKNDINAILFQTIKLVSLKKLWALTSEEDQYSILLSSECGYLGLNKLPLSPKSSNQSSKKYIDPEKLMYLCGAGELKEIAPFMTKDILAESLLNIKKIFPESFPSITGRLCETISSINESVLKDEGYSKFFIGEQSISSAKEFSLWLQDTFNQAGIAMEDLTPKAVFKKSLKEAKKQYQITQVRLKEVFEKAHAEDKLNTPVLWEENPQFYIKKLSDGTYAYMKDPKDVEKEKKSREEAKALALKEGKQMYEKNQADLGRAYDTAQKDGAQELVPVKNHEGFFIKKTKDGKYIYVIDEKLKKKVEAEIAKQKDMEKQKLNPSLSYMLEPESQAQLKNIYEIQKLAIEEGLYVDITFPLIKKDNDGLYLYDSEGGGPTKSFLQELDTKMDNLTFPAQIYLNEMTKDNDNKIIPEGMGPGSVTINEDGNMKVVNMESKGTDNFKLVSEPRRQLNGAINIVIKDNYQNAVLAEQKMTKLSPSESIALLSYTGTGYGPINDCLRKSNCNKDQNEKISKISNALKKLKAEDENKSNDFKLLYRGAILPKKIAEELRQNPKDYVLDKGFMSTSGNVETARAFTSLAMNTLMAQIQKGKEAMVQAKKEEAGAKIKEESLGLEASVIEPINDKSTLFIIKAKSCSGISSLSKIKSEDEFLCPPGMKFNVTQKESGDNAYIRADKVYILEEVLP